MTAKPVINNVAYIDSYTMKRSVALQW